MRICRVPSCYRLEELGWLLLGGNIGIERDMQLAANNVVCPLYYNIKEIGICTSSDRALRLTRPWCRARASHKSDRHRLPTPPLKQ